jgi:hypothetical protein
MKHKIAYFLRKTEIVLEKRFGWFFYNGRKYDRYLERIKQKEEEFKKDFPL